MQQRAPAPGHLQKLSVSRGPAVILTCCIALLLSGCNLQLPHCYLLDDNEEFCNNEDDSNYYYDDNYEPVYLSYADLRSSVEYKEPQSLGNIERIYLYGNYILVNNKNSGIHVIDNSNPEMPVQTGFINLPGNTEIEIKENYLYADSYIDLVTIDLNTLPTLTVTNRVEAIFPYNEYQNIPSNISFNYGSVDQSKGVVVGYE